MSLPKSRDAHDALKRDYATNRDEAKWQVGVAGMINLYGLIAENPNSSEVFLQCFNKASAGDVTLGTTVPDFTIGIPATGKIVLDQLRPVFNFNKGLICAVTATRTGSGSITTDNIISLYYSQS